MDSPPPMALPPSLELEPVPQFEFRDEHEDPVNPLKPQKSLTLSRELRRKMAGMDKEVAQKKFMSALESNFAYYSATYDLEVEGDRIQELQSIVDTMTAGENMKARVVIMNRGRGPNAFVTRDGTIFVSQSLLNMCESKDEIGAVLAHELNHLLFETSDAIDNADSMTDSLTLGWLHEIAADGNTDKLMVRANLNTRAMESIIERLSSASRDAVHMTGLTRAIMKAGQHRVKDTATSNNPLQELPAGLKVPALTPFTNEELLHLAMEAVVNAKNPTPVLDQVEQQLGKLYGRDLLRIPTVFDHRALRGPHIHKAFLEEMKRRNTGEFSDLDMYFMQRIITTMHGAHYFFPETHSIHPTEPFDSVDNLNARAETAVQFDSEAKVADVMQNIFKSPVVPKLVQFSAAALTAHDVEEAGVGSGIIQVEGNILDIGGTEAVAYICTKLNSVLDPWQFPIEVRRSQEYPEDRLDGGRTAIQRLVQKYGVFILQFAEEDGEDGEALAKEFFQMLKDNGYTVPGGTRINLETEMKRAKNTQSLTYRTNKQFCDVFEIDYTPERVPSNIDETIQWKLKEEVLKPGARAYLRGPEVEEVVHMLQNYMYKATAQEKEVVIRKVWAALDEAKLKPEGDDPRVELTRERVTFDDYNPEEEQLDPLREEIVRVTMKLGYLKALHGQQDPQFYTLVREVMETSSLDISQLSKEELYNLVDIAFTFENTHSHFYSADYRALYNFGTGFEGHTKNTASFDQMLELPWLRELRQRFDTEELAEDPKEFIEQLDQITNQLYSASHVDYFLYDDRILPVLLGRRYRDAMEKHLEQAVTHNDRATMEALLYHLPDSAVRKRADHVLKSQILEDTAISFEDRLRILRIHKDLMGIDGVIRLGRTVTTEAEFLELREVIKKEGLQQLQRASIEATAGMGIDYVSSQLLRDPGVVLQTTQEDPATKREQNTKTAEEWLKMNIKEKEQSSSTYYDPVEGKIIISMRRHGEHTVRSVADLYEGVANLPESYRVGIALKALADHRGLLQSPEGKAKLVDGLTRALNLDQGFVYDAMRCIIEDGQPKLVGMLGSQMLAPLLFRTLDTNAVDINELYNRIPKLRTLVPNHNYLHFLLSAHTEEITRHISMLSESPDVYLKSLAMESVQRQLQVQKLLEQFCVQNAAEPEPPNPRGEIDKGLDTIIAGIEASSPVGVRCLQLARQLRSFGDAIDARLEQSYDRNSGTEKVFVWDNLMEWMDADMPFLRGHIETIGDYLGGGSLFTTFEADLVSPEGDKYKGVVKVLNPNALSIIGETYTEMQRLFGELRNRTNGQYEKEIQFMEMLTDMAHNWCKKDIEDPNFVEDDQQFRHTMKGYKPSDGVHFNIPRVDYKYLSMKVRTEERAPGSTINRILGTAHAEPGKRHLLAREVGRMMYFQLRAPTVKKGKEEYRLLHSDMHAGNFMYDDETGTMSIIDRSMYLRMKPEQCEAALAFIQEKDAKKLVNLLIDDALDTGKVRGMQRHVIKARILGSTALEYMKQQANSSKDVSGLVQAVFSQLPEGAMPSLEMQLLFKNLISVTNLMESQGVSWDDCIE